MNLKTALVFGATGLTGRYLLKLLLNNFRYGKVKVFLRKQTEFPSHEKLEVHVVELSAPENYSHFLQGNDLFCCLGTTISKAGREEAFRAVDYELPVKIAEAASQNNISSFSIMSSLGADVNSSNFYLRTKGCVQKQFMKYRSDQAGNIMRPTTTFII